VEETAQGALETVAPHYGLEKSDAPLLQLEFSETVLTPKQQLTAEGMCDESQCHVLGVEAALENIRKAKGKGKAKAIDINFAELPLKVGWQMCSWYASTLQKN
jgi:hypothetical protein